MAETVESALDRTRGARRWLRYGVLTARRGFALKKDIANCLTIASLRKRIAKKRDLR